MTTQVGEGKSGMLFFSSADREYIVKTVTPNELKFLDRELKSYYDYMVVNGATSLLPRFVGLYFLKLPDKARWGWGWGCDGDCGLGLSSFSHKCVG
jgi:hypothetical protein